MSRIIEELTPTAKMYTPKYLTKGQVLTDEELKRLFIGFLKFNNIYVMYRENIALQADRRFPQDTNLGDANFFYLYGSRIDRRSRVQELLNYAFTWSSTPQGHPFWSLACSQWVNTLHQYKMDLRKYNYTL